MHVHMCAHVCVCVCMHACMCARACVYVFSTFFALCFMSGKRGNRASLMYSLSLAFLKKCCFRSSLAEGLN